jgi:hypothetical protein
MKFPNKSNALSVLMDGPYGGFSHIECYDTVSLFAGGSGGEHSLNTRRTIDELTET